MGTRASPPFAHLIAEAGVGVLPLGRACLRDHHAGMGERRSSRPKTPRHASGPSGLIGLVFPPDRQTNFADPRWVSVPYPLCRGTPPTPGQVAATRIPRVKPALPRTSLHGHDNPHARRDGIACGCGDVRAHHLPTVLEAVVCKLLPGDEPHPRYLQHLVASGMRRRRAGSPATTVAMRMSTTKTGPTTSRTGTHCV